MKLVRYLKIIGAVTVLTLVYIHMQMQIFDLAYQGKNKQQKIQALIEEQGSLTYAILTLKSAKNLGVQLLTENSDMEFIDPNDILSLSTPHELITPENAVSQVQQEKRGNPLLSLLSFATQAEAKGN